MSAVGKVAIVVRPQHVRLPVDSGAIAELGVLRLYPHASRATRPHTSQGRKLNEDTQSGVAGVSTDQPRDLLAHFQNREAAQATPRGGVRGGLSVG
jgi:hypothetical protein